MKTTYYLTPKSTVELLGLTQIAESRRSKSDGSMTILTRGDMLTVQPSEPGEDYKQHEDLLIHKTITVMDHLQVTTEVNKGKWIIKN